MDWVAASETRCNRIVTGISLHFIYKQTEDAETLTPRSSRFKCLSASKPSIFLFIVLLQFFSNKFNPGNFLKAFKKLGRP